MITENGVKVVKDEYPSLEIIDPKEEINKGEEFWDLCFKLYKELGYPNSVTVKVHGTHPDIKSEYYYDNEEAELK